MPSDTLLCGKRNTTSAVTVGDYQHWLREPDQGWSKKPDFIKRRLCERYIDPVRELATNAATRDKNNGFYVMAISCLLIETLEAFWQGWETTEPHVDACGNDVRGRSGKAFALFFKRQHRFRIFDGTEFYKRVRCGILHQGETTDGWLIARRGPLFDGQRKINASCFHNQLRLAISDYVEELTNPSVVSDVRQNFDKKMASVIRNCN